MIVGFSRSTHSCNNQDFAISYSVYLRLILLASLRSICSHDMQVSEIKIEDAFPLHLFSVCADRTTRGEDKEARLTALRI